jgi:UDP-glucose 4-epimerase
VDTVARVGGRPVPVAESPRRPGDPPELIAAPGRAREVLGWTPQYSDLDTIVQHAWAWHDQHRHDRSLGDSG